MSGKPAASGVVGVESLCARADAPSGRGLPEHELVQSPACRGARDRALDSSKPEVSAGAVRGGL